MTFFGFAKLAVGLALTGLGAPSQAASGLGAVVCLIAVLDLHFPDPSPGAKGLQWSEGHVEIRCTNTSTQTQRVSVEVVDNSDNDNNHASTHPLTTQRPHGPPLLVSFFADPQRSQPLSSSRSNAQALRASLQIEGNSTSLQRIPIYASFRLEALMAAGTYSGKIPLKLTYKLQP